MTDELTKALEEAKGYKPSGPYQTYIVESCGESMVTNQRKCILKTEYENHINKYEHFATLALAENKQKDERIKELELEVKVWKDNCKDIVGDSYGRVLIDRYDAIEKQITRLNDIIKRAQKALRDKSGFPVNWVVNASLILSEAEQTDKKEEK